MEAVLRSARVSLSFLSPRIHPTSARASNTLPRYALRRAPHGIERLPAKAFSRASIYRTQAAAKEEDSEASSSAEQPPSPGSSTESQPKQSGSPRVRTVLDEQIGNLLDFTSRDKPRPSRPSRSSRHEAPSPQSRLAQSHETALNDSGTKSNTASQRYDIGSLMDRIRANTPSRSAGMSGRSKLDLDRMADPSFIGSSPGPITNIPRRLQPTPTPLPDVQLGPRVGRSVKVDGRRVDLGRAFRLLDSKCRQNSVRADFNKQRFHERPGLKRKRLKMQRWRKRFKTGFQAIVTRVQDMRRKGW